MGKTALSTKMLGQTIELIGQVTLLPSGRLDCCRCLGCLVWIDGPVEGLTRVRNYANIKRGITCL